MLFQSDWQKYLRIIFAIWWSSKFAKQAMAAVNRQQ